MCRVKACEGRACCGRAAKTSCPNAVELDVGGWRRNCQKFVKKMLLLAAGSQSGPGSDRSTLAQYLSKFAAEDLAGGGFWDGVDEVDFARLLVVGEAVGDEGAEFLFHFLAVDESVAEGDEGDWDLACLGTGTANHAAFFHRGMFEQNGFDLSGGDGEALVLNHFLTAINDAVKTFAVARDDVARPEPSIAKNCRRGLRFFPVAEHELWSAHDEFAGMAGWRFGQIVGSVGGIDVGLREHAAIGLRERVSDGIGAIERGFKEADVGDRRGFGHAVSLAHRDAGEGGETARQFGRERRGARFYPLHFVFAGELAGFGSLAQCIHRWRNQRHG